MTKRAMHQLRKVAHFQIDAALFEELGERLVSKPEIALTELVKNAYDADALTCSIAMKAKSIVVADDGHGLTEKEFLTKWMVVSTQEKGIRRFSREFARTMAGSKGVGRFSARFLGAHLELISISRNADTNRLEKLTATFDWKAMARAKTVASVTIPYTIEPVSNVPSGTELRISELREHIQELSRDRVKTDILRLIDPAAGLEAPPFLADRQSLKAAKDPGFSVKFADDDTGSVAQENIAINLLDSYVARARLVVDEFGAVDFRIFWRGEDAPIEKRRFSLAKASKPYTVAALNHDAGERDDRGLPRALQNVQQLPLATTFESPIFLDVRFFPRRAGTFTNLSVNGTVAQAWLKENGSLAIVDNGFAMSAYTDPNSDWLGIEASKAHNERSWQSVFTSNFYPMDPADKADPKRNPMLALPRMSQLVGRVHLSTRKLANQGNDDGSLQPNMDRESLRANGAFNLLWHLCRFAVEAIAHFDRKRRLQEQEKREREAQKSARTALANAIAEIKRSTKIEPAYRSQIVEQLEAVEARAEESAAYEQEVRLSLELMSLMGVMAGLMTHEFEKAVGEIQRVARNLKRMLKERPEYKEVIKELLESEASLANHLDYMRLFVNKARSPLPQPFKARAQISVAAETLKSLASAHGINVVLDVDPRLPGPYVPLAAYHGVVINLVSNAMKALVPKAGSEPRRIRIYATNEEDRHILVCADNGIGVPEYLRDRIWDPLFTTTSDDTNPLGSGLGLGLSVVQRVVQRVGGRIELMATPPPGFITAFRVVFPLQEG